MIDWERDFGDGDLTDFHVVLEIGHQFSHALDSLSLNAQLVLKGVDITGDLLSQVVYTGRQSTLFGVLQLYVLQKVVDLLLNHWLRIDILAHLLVSQLNHFAIESVHLHLEIVHAVNQALIFLQNLGTACCLQSLLPLMHLEL